MNLTGKAGLLNNRDQETNW